MTLTKLDVSLTTQKFIPGGSQITVVAPWGFNPHCALFQVRGLASTTTCSAKYNKITFTVDTQDPQEAATPLGFSIYLTNPEFTPQPNDWSFLLVDQQEMFLDIKERLPGYDITGLFVDLFLNFLQFRGFEVFCISVIGGPSSSVTVYLSVIEHVEQAAALDPKSGMGCGVRSESGATALRSVEDVW